MADLYSSVPARPPVSSSMAQRFNTNAGAAQMQQRTSAAFNAPLALSQMGSHATQAVAASGLSFRMQDQDLASHAVMSSAFTSDRSNDLLGQDFATSEPLKIDFDQGSFVFNQLRLPKDVGKSLILSLGNKGLHADFGTQLLDVAPEHRVELPAGNHDLVQSIDLELQTNFKKAFIVDFKTVFALGNEHYFGNTVDKTGNNTGTKTVSVVILPSNLDKNGCVSINIVKRTITQPMLQFLARFPNQTADTIDNYVTPVNKDEVLLHYSPVGNIRPTSCVALWHHAYQMPTKVPLVENEQGFAGMQRELYNVLSKQAKNEISRHISLADVTSPNFAIEIRDFAPNDGAQANGLGAFETQYPGVDPNMEVEDKWGQRMTALELFEKTPMEWVGRITTSYRKINDGK